MSCDKFRNTIFDYDHSLNPHINNVPHSFTARFPFEFRKIHRDSGISGIVECPLFAEGSGGDIGSVPGEAFDVVMCRANGFGHVRLRRAFGVDPDGERLRRPALWRRAYSTASLVVGPYRGRRRVRMLYGE